MKKQLSTKSFPKRWIELANECGVTSISLKNLFTIQGRGLKLIAISLLWDKDKATYYTKAYFKPKTGKSVIYFHLFIGFSVGGEGNRGFSQLLQCFSGKWQVVELHHGNKDIIERQMILTEYVDLLDYKVTPINIKNHKKMWENYHIEKEGV